MPNVVAYRETFITWMRSCIMLGPVDSLRYGKALLFGGDSWVGIPLVDGHRSRVFVRGGTSDGDVFHQVLVERTYQLPHFDKDVGLVLDLGANVGYASVYFAEMFPKAKIVSLEPDSRNFECLSRNAAPYPNITPVNKGVWWRTAKVSASNPDAAGWALQFVEAADGLDAVTVDSLLDAYPTAGAVVVKMDIEGAESHIFSQRPKWLNRVDCLYLEIHDCWREVFDGMSGVEYAAQRYGETLRFLIKRR